MIERPTRIDLTVVRHTTIEELDKDPRHIVTLKADATVAMKKATLKLESDSGRIFQMFPKDQQLTFSISERQTTLPEVIEEEKEEEAEEEGDD